MERTFDQALEVDTTLGSGVRPEKSKWEPVLLQLAGRKLESLERFRFLVRKTTPFPPFPTRMRCWKPKSIDYPKRSV